MLSGATYDGANQPSAEEAFFFCFRNILFTMSRCFQELDQLELKAELYEKLGMEDDLDKAAEVLQMLLERSPDQWSYYVSLIQLADKRHGEWEHSRHSWRVSARGDTVIRIRMEQ